MEIDYTALARQVENSGQPATVMDAAQAAADKRKSLSNPKTIDYDALARQVETGVPQRFDAGFGPGVVQAGKNFLKGTAEFASDLAEANPITNPNPITRATAGLRIAKGVGESVMRPVREIGGIPQPGENETTYKPFDYEERVPAAIGTFMGADPARVRERERAGDPGGAWAERLTAPAINLALTKGLNAVGERSLPPVKTRVDYLTRAAGADPGIAEAFERVLPQLDKTTKMPVDQPALRHSWSTPPVWWSGKVPESATQLHGLVNSTLGRLEGEVQAELRPRINEVHNLSRIADELENQIKAGHKEWRDGEDAAYIKKRADALRKDYTLGGIDDERHRLYRKRQSPMQERILKHSDPEVTVDDFLEDSLRDYLYDTLERGPDTPVFGAKSTAEPTSSSKELARVSKDVDFPRLEFPEPAQAIDMEIVGNRVNQKHPNGYFHKLKADEAALLTLKDQLEGTGRKLRATEASVGGMLPEEKFAEKGTLYVHRSPNLIAHPLRGNKAITPSKAARMVRRAYRESDQFPLAPTSLGIGASREDETNGQYPYDQYPHWP